MTPSLPASQKSNLSIHLDRLVDPKVVPSSNAANPQNLRPNLSLVSIAAAAPLLQRSSFHPFSKHVEVSSTQELQPFSGVAAALLNDVRGRGSYQKTCAYQQPVTRATLPPDDEQKMNVNETEFESEFDIGFLPPIEKWELSKVCDADYHSFVAAHSSDCNASSSFTSMDQQIDHALTVEQDFILTHYQDRVDSSRKLAEYHIKKLKEYMVSDNIKNFDALDSKFLERLIKSLIASGLKLTTILRYTAHIKLFFDYLISTNKTSHVLNPMPTEKFIITLFEDSLVKKVR